MLPNVLLGFYCTGATEDEKPCAADADRPLLPSYAHAVRSSVLVQRALLSSYSHAMHCPVQIYRRPLAVRTQCAIPRTDNSTNRQPTVVLVCDLPTNTASSAQAVRPTPRAIPRAR
eukprot:2589037-Rhodomonas_salina.1